MPTYKVVLEIDTENGNPIKWNWADLLGEEVSLWEVEKL